MPASQVQTMQRGVAPLTTCTDVQNIRVNVHFLQHDDGSGNFTEFNDGHPCNPSTAVTGYSYADALIWAANGQMDTNPVLRLAPGSSQTPVPKRIKWVLDGVFFDRSSFYRDAAGANGSSFQDHGPLCIKADSVLNIFLVEEVPSPFTTTASTTCGSLIGNSVGNRGYVYSSNQADCATRPAPAKMYAVVASPWTNYILNGAQPWQIASALNHELCHLLGLQHSFEGLSGCADAPPHPNAQPSAYYYPQCWNLNANNANCDAWTKVSNNLMDYNAAQSSLSICQIGIAQDNLNTCLQDRYVYKCSNCLPTSATFTLVYGMCRLPNTGPSTGFWLDGRAAYHNHSFKIELDEVLPPPFGGLARHWEQTYSRQVGMEEIGSLYRFVDGRTYRVVLRTYNNCGSAAVHVETFVFSNISQVSRSSVRPALPIVATPSRPSTPHD